MWAGMPLQPTSGLLSGGDVSEGYLLFSIHAKLCRKVPLSLTSEVVLELYFFQSHDFDKVFIEK